MTLALPRVVQRPTPNYTPSLIAHDLIVVHRTEGGYTGGSANQLLHNFLGLEVKMSSALALAVGLDVQHNSNPPAPKKTTDELTTVNLVFAF